MVSPETVGMSSERLARVHPAIDKHIGDGKIAGAVTLIARKGIIVDQYCVGLMDREANKPMQPDAIFRVYSMTKPIICVALMTLYERGHFQLMEPVSKYIPAFKDLEVYEGTEGSTPKLAGLAREVTIWDLLTHTSGLTYHFLEYGPVEEMYREARFSSEKPLSELVADLLKLPLAFHPGTAWRYSVAHDVVAHLIEVMSGHSVDAYLREKIVEPLSMVDTGYYVPQSKLDHFVAMYGSGKLMQPDMTATKWYGDAAKGVNSLLASPTDSLESRPHSVFRGGHGLVSTAQDYYRFCQMLLNGGELDGARVLGRKTVELVTTNHLAPEMVPIEIGGTYQDGYGYGLGVGVLTDLNQCRRPGSLGKYWWGGAASTSFWVDPREEFIGIQMAQFQPGGHHLIADDFRVAAYQAIVD